MAYRLSVSQAGGSSSDFGVAKRTVLIGRLLGFAAVETRIVACRRILISNKPRCGLLEMLGFICRGAPCGLLLVSDVGGAVAAAPDAFGFSVGSCSPVR